MAASKSTAGARAPSPQYVGRYGHIHVARLVDPDLWGLRDAHALLVNDLNQLLIAIQTGSALDEARNSIEMLLRRDDQPAPDERLQEWLPADPRDLGSGLAGDLAGSAVRRLREIEDVFDALVALAAPARARSAS